MKRLILFVVAVALLSVVPVVAAVGVDDGPQSMAQYFPADTTVFFSFRTDEAYIDQLGGVYDRVVAQLPLDGPAPDFRDLVDEFLTVQGDPSYGDLKTWLGDNMAFGIFDIGAPNAGENLIAVIDVIDEAGALDYFATTTARDTGRTWTQTTEGGFTTLTAPDGSVRFVIGQNVAMLLSGSTANPLLTRDAKLNTVPDFIDAYATLPAPNYNITAYVNPLVLAEFDPTLDPGDLSSFAVGLTILDERTLVIDMGQLPTANRGAFDVARVDPTFNRYIPADTSAVIHATDLPTLYDTLTTALSEESGEDIAAQVRGGLSLVGLDIDDILTWATGDYALFFDSDLPALIEATAGSFQPNLAPFVNATEFGLVIGTKDPMLATATVNDLTLLLRGLAGQSDGVLTVEETTVAGQDVTLITLETPVEPRFQLELVLTVYEDVFLFASRAAAETIFNGSNPLANAPAYQAASAYYLPDATSIWYTDGEGFFLAAGTISIVTLTLLGPVIGDMFEDILDDLDDESAWRPAANGFASVGVPLIAQEDDPVQMLIDAVGIIEHSTITSTVDAGGAIIVRLTVTISE